MEINSVLKGTFTKTAGAFMKISSALKIKSRLEMNVFAKTFIMKILNTNQGNSG